MPNPFEEALSRRFGSGGNSVQPLNIQLPTAAQTPFVAQADNPFTEALGNQATLEYALDNPGQDVRTTAVGGFLNSSLSSFAELFGAEAGPYVQAYRAENPFMGLASQLIGPGGAYGAVYKLSKLPRLAAALDATVTRLGMDVAARPVLGGVTTELVRYAPLEAMRLGAGLVTTEDWDGYGNLLADVGLSVAFTGGFGGIGGFFRAGGTRAPQQGRVAGADVGLHPVVEFRLARQEGAQVSGDLPLQQVAFNLRNEVLTGVPMGTRVRGQKLQYVHNLEGGTPATEGLLNAFFNPQGARLSASQLEKRGFDIRLLAEDVVENTRTVNPGEQEALVRLAGFETVDDLAESVFYPRVVKVNSQRAAGWAGKELDNAFGNGLQRVSDDVMLGRETDDGLFIFAKRLVRTERNAKGQFKKTFGGQRVSEGDVWLIGKTDVPERLVPESHKVISNNMSRWARMREPFRIAASADPFDNNMNAILEAVDPSDWAALSTMRRKAWTGRMAEKIRQRVGQETGLAGQNSTRQTAEWMYDVFMPTLYKEQRNPVYARLYGLLRGSMDYADSTLNKLMGGKARFKSTPSAALRGAVDFEPAFNGHTPVRQLWAQLDDAERQLVVRAAQTQTPADELATLTATGQISPRAAAVVEELQKINEEVLSDFVMPALNNAGIGGDFKLLEGYILPRIFKGDWIVEVVDEKGALRWMSAGTTPRAAQREAQAVVQAAAEEGKTYTLQKARSIAADTDPDQLSNISDMVRLAMGQDKEAQAIVQRAMRQIGAARGGAGRENLIPTRPGLMKKRSGIPGTPDSANYTLDDVVAASENHYRQLLRFAAYHSWRQRWMPVANSMLKNNNETMFNDLIRKSNQFLGIEGRITNVLNRTLAPVLGPVLGGKAATRIAQETNKLMYAWNLGILNPTFAVLNLLTPLQTVAPWISYMTHASSEDLSRMMQYVPRYGADGLPRGSLGMLHPMKVLGQAVRSLRNPSDELKQMMEEAVTDGTLAPQLYNEWVGSSAEAVTSLRGAFQNGGGWGFIKETATWMATKSENFSRAIAFNSAYHLGRDVFKLEGDQLYRFMRRGTNVTMYGYGVVDRARAMTGPVGSMFGLFKNWQFHFIGSMAQYANLGMRDGIWAPMLWQGGAALSLGGLGATPLVLAADGLARWNSDSPSSFHWLEENWNGAADEIYFGLPALLGVSLQSSAAIPGTDVRNEIANLSNFVFIERAKAAGQAIGAAWDYGETSGQNPLTNDNVRDGLIGALAPRAIFRAFASTEGDYVRSMRSGLPSVRGLDPSTKVLYGLGINQVDIERYQIAGRELYSQQESRRSRIAQLGMAYSEAQLNRDTEEMQRIVQRTIAYGLPVSSVMSSSQTRMRREQGDALDRYDRAAVQNYMNALDN